MLSPRKKEEIEKESDHREELSGGIRGQAQIERGEGTFEP